MLRIRQTATGWELWQGDTLVASGTTAPAPEIGPGTRGYALALCAAAAQIRAIVAAGEEGLLDDVWTSESGIAFTEPTGPYRDFSNCTWSWRDPTAGLVPLMLQTENEGGHYGATLAGFVERFWQTDGTVYASGRFYDLDAGVKFRDLLGDGRSFGVSVDPSENVEVEWRCTEFDEDMGFCMAGVDDFLAYEIAGLTGVPFPGFERASIMLTGATADGDGVVEEAEAIAAAAAVARGEVTHVAPVAPPAGWFDDPQLSDVTPMTVMDDGRVFGHLAAWGVCHIGYDDVCVTAPVSVSEYAYFRTGEVVCDDGTRPPVGVLTMGLGHAPLEATAVAAIAHYDNTRYGVADLASGEDEHGIWIAGAVRPGLDDTQVRTLRASSPSGDWRGIRGHLELVAALCVNVPGFPIPRPQARVAAGRCVALLAAGPKAGPGRPAHVDAEIAALRREHARLRAAIQPFMRAAADAHLAAIRGNA